MTSKSAMAAITLAIGTAVAAGGALAQDVMPRNANAATRAAYARHENFEKLGAALKAISDELRKPQPAKAVLTSNANTIATLSRGLPTWFPRGSGVEARPRSEARPEVWTDAAGFAAASSSFSAQAAKLNQAAAGGDLAAIRAEARQTFMSCRSCHEKYRQEKKD